MVSSLAAHGSSSREVAEQGLEAIVVLGFDNDAAINRELGEAGAATGDTLGLLLLLSPHFQFRYSIEVS